jgi:hypothetical protein
MKVATRVATAPHCLALGIVTAAGETVVWHAIIDMTDGSTGDEYGVPMRFGKTPKPLRGGEVPCPRNSRTRCPTRTRRTTAKANLSHAPQARRADPERHPRSQTPE